MWWERAVVYQVYPRSYADSNADGIGDLQGVISKLDYLEWLGVDAVWLSPTFPSPNRDWGYDVSDYLGVHPDFGTPADLEQLIVEARRRRHARPRPEPHVERASVVPRPVEARLVRLARLEARRLAAEQLEVRVR